jgi:hypothetical protein
VKAETEAGRMPNQLIGGILSIEVTSFFRNILFLYQMMIQHMVARFRLGLQRHNNNFAVFRSIIFAMIYLAGQIQALIYSQGDPRNSDSFNLSKVSIAMGIHLTGFKKGHCFSLHGLVLHPGNNNPKMANEKEFGACSPSKYAIAKRFLSQNQFVLWMTMLQQNKHWKD